MSSPLPRLYREFAPWFHLLTAPADYAEEAELYTKLAVEACDAPPRTLLELGSGGGNNASHYKAHFQATLADLSPAMLAISRELNPECEHVEGDMRTVRLGRLFDVVFVHDAVEYLVTGEELRACMATAFVHCRPGGVAIFAPDCTRETFREGTAHGGHDGDGRALRYLEWTWDPDPADTQYTVDFAYLLRTGDDVQVAHDRHIFGLFSRAEWLAWLQEAGFAEVSTHPRIEDASDIFVARRAARPDGAAPGP
ncbi:class I SAM-dependent methyltransferase [bacterium]|nr:MAG: class I SAM-dependent methyltransferase [bacterium]MCL4230310.1 methyltransferase domain-containing protein [Dehalococcoidia bacterium]